jgi:hypothetical protein
VNEVAWFLRWALSRVVRLVREDKVVDSPGRGKGGKVVTIREREVRGLVDVREYEVWRGKERGESPFTSSSKSLHTDQAI